MKTLKIRKVHPDAITPTYAHDGDSCMDLYVLGDYVVQPKQVVVVHTGIAIQLEKGYEAQVRSRSGLSTQHRISVINSPGTVDSTYTGEIKVGLYNGGDYTYRVNNGNRVAQLAICPVMQPTIEVVDNFDVETARGVNGFGSTGT